MSLEVAAPLRAEAQGELWMAKRHAVSADTPSKKTRTDYGERAARFASATARGVATLVPADQKIDKDYLDATGFRQPLLVRSPAQLDLHVPARGSMTLRDLEATIGAERAVRAIDVATQQELASEMKLKEWMQYFGQSPATRERVLNLISLECTGTGLDAVVRPPKVVQDIGWVEKHWATVSGNTAVVRKERALKPKVRLYCLMSAAGSYTESHVDFGGSSVWYHLFKGHKYFFVMPPTDANLTRFAQWEAAYQHGKAPFFGDLVPQGDCTVIEMREGDTMMLPSGWIHAVYTPEDSISFGGNFLSGYHIATHVRCHAKEKQQQIEGRFFFPEFECAVWYAAAYYAKILSTCRSVLSKWEWQGLPVLLKVLDAWLSSAMRGPVGSPESGILARVVWICKTVAHCQPADMLKKMATLVQHDDGKDADRDAVDGTASGEASTAVEERATVSPRIQQVQVSAIEDRRGSVSRIGNDDSSSSSSSDESSSNSSDSSSNGSSDGEDTGKESDHGPPAGGDDDNGDTNESSSDSSSDDDSSSSSSENEEEASKEPDDEKEPLKEEPEEFDEPEESSSSDSENDFDPESAYPDLPPLPVDALIAVRKRAKLKELQITKQGKEQVIALAREHILERQRSARSKKKSAKAGLSSGASVAAIAPWGEEEHWMVACSCGLGGQDYDDGREMVECNNCKSWVHIGCIRIPLHEIFWCFKCRASEEWLFMCGCGIKEKNFDDGGRMVQCGVCEIWQHTKCGGVADTEEPPDIYECTNCRKLRKKSRPSSASQQKSKTTPKNKKRGNAITAKKKAELLTGAATVVPPVPVVPPLPSPPTKVASSPPPPPPPPPSAPPSPGLLDHEEDAARVTKPVSHAETSPSPVLKRKRGRPPLGTTRAKGKKTKQDDEDYRESIDGPVSPAGVNGASAMMRPPLPITPKSSGASGKRKSGGSARDRLEKKLKSRKSRG